MIYSTESTVKGRCNENNDKISSAGKRRKVRRKST